MAVTFCYIIRQLKEETESLCKKQQTLMHVESNKPAVMVTAVWCSAALTANISIGNYSFCIFSLAFILCRLEVFVFFCQSELACLSLLFISSSISFSLSSSSYYYYCIYTKFQRQDLVKSVQIIQYKYFLKAAYKKASPGSV